VEKDSLEIREMFKGEPRGKLRYFVVGKIQLDDLGKVLEVIILLKN
jgi:hypothetical protein